MNTTVIQPERILRLTEKILEKVGVSESDARIIADSLIDADLKGVHSHGIIRLPIYIKRVQSKAVKTNPIRTETRKKENIAIVDADDGFGQPVSVRAVELAVNAAKTHGIAVVGVKNSHHYGTAAYYSSMIASQQMIGIAMSNTTPLMPAIGGSEAVVGNNPLSIAIPAKRHLPVILDMATSVVAMGKILQAQKANKPIPIDWGMDKHGKPTTKAEGVLESGLYNPLGGPKGFGLAFMIDVLSGVLLNGAFGNEVQSIYKEVDKPNRCGHFFIVLDIEGFLPIKVYHELIDSYIDQIKSSERAAGIEEIYMPGELEFKKETEHRKSGIPILTSVYKEITTLARSLGINETEIINGFE